MSYYTISEYSPSTRVSLPSTRVSILLLVDTPSSYQCFYCAFNGQDRDCFFHTLEEHPDKVLKLKKQELSSKTGKLGYRTLNFNVIPDFLNSTNKSIKPVFLKGRISIRISTSPDFDFSDLSLGSNNDMPSENPLCKNRRT